MQDAITAARFLSSLGHGQLSQYSRAIRYNTVEPYVAALLQWLGTLNEDVAIHLQLPPALAALRGIWNAILDQSVSTATRASLIDVGDALQRGGTLSHPADSADTLGVAHGGLDTHPVAETAQLEHGRAPRHRHRGSLGPYQKTTTQCHHSSGHTNTENYGTTGDFPNGKTSCRSSER